MQLDTLIDMLALAAALESEGQYNNAKLLRAATDAWLRRAAFDAGLPADRPTLLGATDRIHSTLAALEFSADFLQALDQAGAALADRRLALYSATPDPFVCRICGQLMLNDDAPCPHCGAQPATFQRFRSIYWLEAFDPFTALAHLRATPYKVAALLTRAADDDANRVPASGGWSLRQAVTHLRDAQGVLDFRVNLMLAEDNPRLTSQAVFAWATDASDQPESLDALFDSYRTSRAQTIARLETLPLQAWWRSGQHEEFGNLKLYHQVSYFTCHELTHWSQLAQLASAAAR